MFPKRLRRQVVPPASLATSRSNLSFSLIGPTRFIAALETKILRKATAVDGFTTKTPFASVYLRSSLCVGVSSVL